MADTNLTRRNYFFFFAAFLVAFFFAGAFFFFATAMDIRADEISKIIRDQLGSHAVEIDVAEVGSVISVGDGIARVHGVERAMNARP